MAEFIDMCEQVTLKMRRGTQHFNITYQLIHFDQMRNYHISSTFGHRNVETHSIWVHLAVETLPVTIGENFPSQLGDCEKNNNGDDDQGDDNCSHNDPNELRL